MTRFCLALVLNFLLKEETGKGVQAKDNDKMITEEL